MRSASPATIEAMKQASTIPQPMFTLEVWNVDGYSYMKRSDTPRAGSYINGLVMNYVKHGKRERRTSESETGDAVRVARHSQHAKYSCLTAQNLSTTCFCLQQC